jgi:hemoglobin
MADPSQPAGSPFELVGGEAVVRRVVDRFYDLMDSDPGYGELRALHKPDLAPMRQSLACFLNAWLGGPRTWFEERPGMCVMSAHRDVAITEAAARQWADAMERAVLEQVPDPALAPKLAEALGSLARGMGAGR